jgi:hypothetical protein
LLIFQHIVDRRKAVDNLARLLHVPGQSAAVVEPNGVNKTNMIKKLLSSAALLVAATSASASITPTLTGAPVAMGGGNYAWTYDVILTPDQRLTPNSYFTIYDFNYLVGAGTHPANWTYTSSLLGTTPALTNPGDDAAVWNATFTYTGPTITPPNQLTGVALGQFTLIAKGNHIVTDFFTSRARRNGGPQNNTIFDTIGFTSVAGVVPEPSAWAMLVAGFGMVGFSMRRRSNAVSA